MITVYIMGGIGNQLYQYAAGRRLARKLNTELKLDTTFYEHDNLRPYVLNLFNIKETIATPEEIQRARKFSKESGLGVEPFGTNFMPEVLDYPDNVWLYGYWANEIYFADIADILRREFTLKNSLSAAAQRWKEKIFAAECSVSLHFRHGDFLYSPINLSNPNNYAIPPLDYYYQCIELLRREYKNLTLFIFSDNLNWVKENFRSDLPTEFVEGEDLQDVEELYLMSLCKHNIIANSTFSWWGAWLNQNPDKKVFMSTLANNNTPIKTPNNQIDSDRWIRIPFDISEQPAVTLRPYFSILLVVNNGIDTLGESLNSIIGQDYKFFELIIIDNATTDGSGKICREVAKTHDNVTLIKLHDKIPDGAAWNIALKATQGYYVMFLKNGDRILANALTSLYLTNEHIVADVVNYTAYVKEDPRGDIELAGKKFVLKIISVFKNLQVAFRNKMDKQTLLKVMACDETFPPLGTRIFRREFLLEHEIEFKEKIGDDAEVLFTLDAMFQTDAITFISNVFYVAPRDKA